MFIIMFIVAVIFVTVVFYLAKVVVLQLEQGADEDVMKAKSIYLEIIEQKNRAIAEKSRLEKEAAQIFTLYEMTKDITKNFNEPEAFKTFLKKLKENIQFEDCRILDVSLEKLKEIRSAKDYTIFPLKSKERKLGYLIYKGVSETDKEKFVILAHQFALALRRIKLYQDIERMAITDSLTEVHTRRYFMERFEEEIGRAALRKTPLALLLVDVDHFKHFNDQYGHLTGDRILKTMGQILRESIREIDIAGRYGGEEFCVVLPETDLEGAILAGERIRKATENAIIQAYDHTVKVSLSGGVAVFPQDGQTADELIDKADWALYRAKTLGRNRIVAFGKYKDKS
jgi:diguanylate cyclase (GGDEF)-like protein